MKLKLHTIVFSSLLIAAAFTIFSACESDSDADNPYDNVNYGNGNGNGSDLDSTTIQGIHQQILFPKCANPGCHDGTFEPDFRTVQSSYSTLVYQGVNKVTVDSVNYFDYRVIPFDVNNSVLHERLVTPTFDYMPSNAVRLSAQEIANIDTWINNGAQDMFGNIPTVPPLPNQQPYIPLYAPFYQSVQIDTNRMDGLFYNPFLVVDSIIVDMAFLVSDDSTYSGDMTNALVKVSTDAYDFTNAQQFTPTFLPYTGGIWLAQIDMSLFPVGTQMFMRFYCNDGDHVDDMEYPNDDTPYFEKSYFSFKVYQ